jgi:hypothetical protein
VEEATTLFNRSIDHMKEQDDRDLVDYYAADLADMAVDVLTSWLALRGATSERRRELASVYASAVLPRFRGRMLALQASDPTPLRAKDLILLDSR